MGKGMGGQEHVWLCLPTLPSPGGRKTHDHSLILEKVVGLEDNEEKEGQKKMLTCSAQTPAVWEVETMHLQGCLSPAREVSSQPPPLC